MTICVTGASGHLGANLVRGLIEAGHEVRALVREDDRALAGTGADLARVDILDPGSLARTFGGIEVVFHCAARIGLARWDLRDLRLVNGTGTANVVDACLAAGVRRLVHFSTVHVFRSEPMDRPIDESRPAVREGECLEYDWSKSLGDAEVERGIRAGLDAVILHPSGMIGPCDWKPSNMGALILALTRGRMPVLVSGSYDFVDARDVVRSAIAAIERGRSGERYILSGHRLSLRLIADTVCELCGSRPPLGSLPVAVAHLGVPFVETFARIAGRRPLYTRSALVTISSNSNFDCAKARRDLGHDPRPMRETLADTLDWFRSGVALPS